MQSRRRRTSKYLWQLTAERAPDGSSNGCSRQWGEHKAVWVVWELVVAAMEQEVDGDGPVALHPSMEGKAVQRILDQLPEQPAAAHQAGLQEPRKRQAAGQAAQAAKDRDPECWHHPPAHSFNVCWSMACQLEHEQEVSPGSLGDVLQYWAAEEAGGALHRSVHPALICTAKVADLQALG